MRPQTSMPRLSTFIGVQGGMTFVRLPALVFHHLNFRAGSAFTNWLLVSRSTAPLLPTTVSLAEYLPSGRPGSRITPRI